jgi:hypothetical protein
MRRHHDERCGFPKRFKKPRRYGSGRRVTERDRLEMLLMEINAMAKHIAAGFEILQERVHEFNERV